MEMIQGVSRREKIIQILILAFCIMLLAWDLYMARGGTIFGYWHNGFVLELIALVIFLIGFIVSLKNLQTGARFAFVASALSLIYLFPLIGSMPGFLFHHGPDTAAMIYYLQLSVLGAGLISSQQILRTAKERTDGIVRLLFFRFQWTLPIRIAALAAGALVTSYLLIGWASPRIACHLSDGDWVRDGIFGHAEYCLLENPDGGKACRNSSECQGRCILQERWNPRDPVPTAGVCSYTNRPFGCNDYLDYPQVNSMCAD